MQSVMHFLNGKKTYIQSGLATVIVGLWMFGVVPDDVATECLVLLGFGTAVSLRAGISKGQVKISTPFSGTTDG